VVGKLIGAYFLDSTPPLRPLVGNFASGRRRQRTEHKVADDNSALNWHRQKVFDNKAGTRPVVGAFVNMKRLQSHQRESSRVLVFAFPFPLISGTFGLHLVCNARGFEGGQSFCRVHSCTAAADRR
jgi:hypothetical protein